MNKSRPAINGQPASVEVSLRAGAPEPLPEKKPAKVASKPVAKPAAKVTPAKAAAKAPAKPAKPARLEGTQYAGPTVIDELNAKQAQARAKLRETYIKGDKEASEGEDEEEGTEDVEAEGGDQAPGEDEEGQEGTDEEAEAPKKKTGVTIDRATAQELRVKDRENRRLRRELDQVRRSGASPSEKRKRIEEIRKDHPIAAAIADGYSVEALTQDLLAGISKKAIESGKLKLPGDDPVPDPRLAELQTELEAERKVTAELRARTRETEFTRQVTDLVNSERVSGKKDGPLLWENVAAAGPKAVRDVFERVEDFIRTAQKKGDIKGRPSAEKMQEVVEHWLGKVDDDWARIFEKRAAKSGTTEKPGIRVKQRNVQRQPKDQWAEFAKDHDGIPQTPTSTQLLADHRKKYLGA